MLIDFLNTAKTTAIEFLLLVVTISVFNPRANAAEVGWEDLLPRFAEDCALLSPSEDAQQALCIKGMRDAWNKLGKTYPSTASGSVSAVPQEAAPLSDAKARSSFIAVSQKFSRLYGFAQNDIVRGRLRQYRGKEMCSLITNPRVKNWSGVVHSLGNDSDGNGVINIALADNVIVRALEISQNDLQDTAAVAHESHLFERASHLQVGQIIEFSGTFVPSSVDCFKETSPTVPASMLEPKYLIYLFSLKHEDQSDTKPALVASVDPVPIQATQSVQPVSPNPSATEASASRAVRLSPAFMQGMHARIDYELWVLSFPAGDYHDGVQFAISHRNGGAEGSLCEQTNQAFKTGCLDAEKRLARIDAQQLKEPEFKHGWDGL